MNDSEEEENGKRLPTCQVCGEAIEDCDAVFCKVCATPHHKNCWYFVGKCSTYGCGCTSAATTAPDKKSMVRRELLVIDEDSTPPDMEQGRQRKHRSRRHRLRDFSRSRRSPTDAGRPAFPSLVIALLLFGSLFVRNKNTGGTHVSFRPRHVRRQYGRVGKRGGPSADFYKVGHGVFKKMGSAFLTGRRVVDIAFPKKARGTAIVCESNRTSLVFSKDAGKTWKKSFIESASPVMPEFYAIDFNSRGTVGLACGAKGLLLQTFNEGRSWSPVLSKREGGPSCWCKYEMRTSLGSPPEVVDLKQPFLIDFKDICLTDMKYTWALAKRNGKTVLLKSRNLGKSWMLHLFRGDDSWLARVGRFQVVGPASAVFASEDGYALYTDALWASVKLLVQSRMNLRALWMGRSGYVVWGGGSRRLYVSYNQLIRKSQPVLDKKCGDVTSIDIVGVGGRRLVIGTDRGACIVGWNGSACLEADAVPLEK